MNIDDNRWPALSALLDTALELPPADRVVWLESLEGTDKELKDELRRLLERQVAIETGDFLVTLPKISSAGFDDVQLGAANGTVVGPYMIDGEVGRGGMGIVYRAHRVDGLIRRAVALKLLHPGIQSRELIERFDRERDILAALTHANIARLYDAGATDSGQPYIALEFVVGAPLIAYCDARRLDVRARIKLFRQVVRAVQFAHANLVIHRDLKPSNILVTESGEVRLLDFGIAKLLAAAGAEPIDVTSLGGRALTPEYASPEQILGEAVSIASDIYSLGVVLYELLCGSRPFRPKRASVAALEDAIISSDPSRPSQAQITAEAAHVRATTPRALVRLLAGDLDTIALKAMKRAPADRYHTADAFDQDLDRYLRGDAVLAQPDRLLYRAGKLLRRNRLIALSALATIAALSVGLAIALWQAQRATEEARVARSVQAFLQDVFGANSKDAASPLKAQQTPARELLDIGAAKIDTALTDSPRAKLEALETLAAMYHDLGLDEKSVDLEKRRVDLARRVFGLTDVRVAAALRDLSMSLEDTTRVQERPGVLAEALGILDQAGDQSSALRANVLGDLAQHYMQSDLPKALDYARASHSLLARAPPSGDLQEALVMEGTVLTAMSRYQDATALLSAAVDVSKRAFGDRNAHLPHIYEYLAESRYFSGDYAGAEATYREGFELARELDGANHVDALQTESRLGIFLGRTSRGPEAVAVLADAHTRASATLPADDATNLPSVRELYGLELAHFGAIEDGSALLATSTATWRRHYPDSSYVLSALERWAFVLVDRGDYAQARSLLDEATRTRIALKDETSFPNGNQIGRIHLALAIEDWKAADEAVSAYSVPVTPLGALALPALDVALSKAEIMLGQSQFEPARTAAAATATAIRDAAIRVYLAAYEARALRIQGLALLATGQPAVALPILESARTIDSSLYDPALSLIIAAAHADLARCLSALGRTAEARNALAQANLIAARHPGLAAHWKRALELARRDVLLAPVRKVEGRH